MTKQKHRQAYKKISYVLVGPPKTGTTWLAHCLNQHPDLYCANEAHVLSLDWERQPAWSNWHENFQQSKPDQIIGDYGTTYSYVDDVPARLEQLNNNVKIIFSIRDPVDRAISNYRHDLRTGFISPDVPLSQLLSPYILKNRYILPGFYSQHLERYLQYFPAQQIYVFPKPSTHRDNQETLSELFDFLDVPPKEIPSANEKIYETNRPLLPRIHRRKLVSSGLTKKIAEIIDPLNCYLGEQLIDWSVNESDANRIADYYKKNSEPERLKEIKSNEHIKGNLHLESWSI